MPHYSPLGDSIWLNLKIHEFNVYFLCDSIEIIKKKKETQEHENPHGYITLSKH